MKIYLSWMELKQQEDPQSILNKIKTAGKQCYLMLPQIARKRQIILPSGDDCIQVGDNVIIITMEKQIEDIKDILM